MKKNNLVIIQFIGSLLVLVGAALKFFTFDFAKYIFACGAGLLLILQALIMINSKKEDIKVQRFNRLMFLFTALLGFATYYLFIGSSYWLAFLLSYALVTLFLSFRNK